MPLSLLLVLLLLPLRLLLVLLLLPLRLLLRLLRLLRLLSCLRLRLMLGCGSKYHYNQKKIDEDKYDTQKHNFSKTKHNLDTEKVAQMKWR